MLSIRRTSSALTAGSNTDAIVVALMAPRLVRGGFTPDRTDRTESHVVLQRNHTSNHTSNYTESHHRNAKSRVVARGITPRITPPSHHGHTESHLALRGRCAGAFQHPASACAFAGKVDEVLVAKALKRVLYGTKWHLLDLLRLTSGDDGVQLGSRHPSFTNGWGEKDPKRLSGI
jgi:hypothetical protein